MQVRNSGVNKIRDHFFVLLSGVISFWIIFHPMLYDKHGRVINYMRLAVTDRCNLRCFYCMPEAGINYVDKSELMTYEEMLRITRVFVKQGISKVRITGGEPFIRKDMMAFLEAISEIPGLDKIRLTTNGTLISHHLPKLLALGITEINLSLDSLDRQRFFDITRRDDFPKVMSCLEQMMDLGIHVKINMVVMKGRNDEDILPMVELTKNKKITVRFIEEMPFNGTDGQSNEGFLSHVKIMQIIREKYASISKLKDPLYSTSQNYKVEGYLGDFGVIAAYSRTFCGSCNRIRLTPQGTIKTCLYDNGVFNVKNMLRAGASDTQITEALQSALANKPKDGFEAENNRKLQAPVSESMSTIGG